MGTFLPFGLLIGGGERGGGNKRVRGERDSHVCSSGRNKRLLDTVKPFQSFKILRSKVLALKPV